MPADLKRRYFAILDRLVAELNPRELGRESKALGDGLFEFRLHGRETIGRVFYGLISGERLVILNSFIKKTQATPAKELDLARSRLSQFHRTEGS